MGGAWYLNPCVVLWRVSVLLPRQTHYGVNNVQSTFRRQRLWSNHEL